MKYFSLLESCLDPKYQLICQPASDNYDCGDTAQREGMFAFAAYLLHKLGKMDNNEYEFCKERYAKVISLLNDPNHLGLIRRYPDTTYWGGFSDRLSRDQSTPNVIAMGLLNGSDLKRFFFAHLKYRALLFLTNTRANAAMPPGYPGYNAAAYAWKLPDITVLSFHGLYIRAANAWLLYPLLWLTDLEILVNAIIKVISYGQTPSNNDDLSQLMCQYQSEICMPTLWSKMAKWIYNKFRPYPAQAGNATNPAQAAMNAYFNGDNPGPRLDMVYQEINSYFYGRW
jgi:hypothetical protein